MVVRLKHFFRTPALIAALLTALASGCAELEPYNLYFGDVHGHTALSDGKGSPDEYFTHARDVSALDFVVISDHDFGNTAPWWLSAETWLEIQASAEEYNEEGRFVAIAGYEWTSAPKYWDFTDAGGHREAHFEGPPMYYNHKNVYFPSPVPDIFRAKEAAYRSPDLLAAAVEEAGGLIQNNHPTQGIGGRDQWDYSAASSAVIVNTEIHPDVVFYQGKTRQTNMESLIRAYLDRGGRTGIVGSTDTHEGKPAARTVVIATGLTREAIFEALLNRRNYAISNARIILDFRIDGHYMGEAIEVEGKPRLEVDVQGTDRIEEVAVIKDGDILFSAKCDGSSVSFELVDDAFEKASYYYLRVTQADVDEHGNPSRAWTSPIWVSGK